MGRRLHNFYPLACCGCILAACGGGTTDASQARGRETRDISRADKQTDVVVSYAATLMNRLEMAAVGELYDDSLRENPTWLTDYRNARVEWTTGPYFRHVDASYVPHLRCSYFREELEDMLGCLRRVLPLRHFDVVAKAVRMMDLSLRPRWPMMRQGLMAHRGKLLRTLRSRDSAELLKSLRYLVGLSPYDRFDHRIVLVATPAGSMRLGRREERVLVIEVDPSHRWTRALTTVFHELTHYASAISPRLVELEEEFFRWGAQGTIAGNYWNESVATAFEQTAAAAFDPNFSLGHELYGDVVVDALARAMFLRWRRRGISALGAGFARSLSTQVERFWPPARWTLANLTFRVVANANTLQVLHRYRSAARAHSFWGISPISSSSERAESIPPSISDLYFVSLADLHARQDLLTRWGFGMAEVRTHALAKRQYWFTQRGGLPPTLVVIGKNRKALGDLALRFANRQGDMPFPGEGWNVL